MIETEIKLPNLNPPAVVIDREIYHKIMHWVHKAEGEVSGLGKVVQLPNGDFKVVSAMMLPQENSAGSTDIEGADVAKAMYELREGEGTLNFWWHSHVNMAVFWSKTDTDTIQTFGDAGGNGGFVVSTVFNKKNENKSSLYFNVPERKLKIFLDDVDTNIMSFVKAEIFAAWDAEYDKNVKKKVYRPSTYTNWRDRNDLDENNFEHWTKKEWTEWTERETKVVGKPVPKGVVTVSQKLQGFSLLYVGNTCLKYPIDRCGNIVGDPIKPGCAFPESTNSKIRQANLALKPYQITDTINDVNWAMNALSIEKLEEALDLFGICEEEYTAELARRGQLIKGDRRDHRSVQ